jgi:hypothetical protein
MSSPLQRLVALLSRESLRRLGDLFVGSTLVVGAFILGRRLGFPASQHILLLEAIAFGLLFLALIFVVARGEGSLLDHAVKTTFPFLVCFGFGQVLESGLGTSSPPPAILRTTHRPAPCVPTPSSLRRMIECAQIDLAPGRLAFEPKREMDQGRPERVFVRLSAEATADLGKGWKNGPPSVQAIQVGPVMRVSLDAAPEDFAVRRLGDEAKVVAPPYTEWAWEVIPLHGGDQTLQVLAYADLMLPNGKSEAYEAFAGRAVIHVHIRPLYVAATFFAANWQWALGSPVVLGLAAWLWARRRPQPRPAGFRAEKSG